jgi:hypothetical protein
MGDSIYPRSIPNGLDAYAGYVDGRWPDYAQQVAMHPEPRARHMSIAAFSDGQADCLDIERGDAIPAQAPGWLASWSPLNTTKPVLYTSASLAGPLVEMLLSAHWARSSYWLWSAHYTDKPHRCVSALCWPSSPVAWSADMTQWTDHGGFWDESLADPNVWDFELHSPPDLPVYGEDPMFLVTFPGKPDLHVTGGSAVEIVDQADLVNVMGALPLPIVMCASVQQWDNYAKLVPGTP